MSFWFLWGVIYGICIRCSYARYGIGHDRGHLCIFISILLEAHICSTESTSLLWSYKTYLLRFWIYLECLDMFCRHCAKLIWEAQFSLSLAYMMQECITSCNQMYVKLFHVLFFNSDVAFCGLMVSVPGYRSRCPGFDSRRYKVFWEVVFLERGPLSFVRITEELLEWKSSGFGLENRY
jgi:hypothetical protein